MTSPSRHDGRAATELRPLKITRGFTRHAEGSVLVEAGGTRVLCTASVEESVPGFLRGKGSGFQRLLHGAMPQSVFDRWNASRMRRGEPAWDPSAIYHLRGVPDESIGMSVDVSSVADRVVAGLREHRSQQHVMGAGPGLDWERAVGMEHYVIAWPSGLQGLTDVFEGLP